MEDSIKPESLGVLVANRIRESIWKKELTFGERLIESDLSEKYGVSRNTVRDALKILEFEELVTSKPRKGTYITQFSKKDWREIIELRILVEAYAFVKVLPLLNNEHFKNLEKILEMMKEKAAIRNWNDLFNLDIQFHRYIVNLFDNSRIIKIYDSIQVQIRTYLLHLDEYYSSSESFYLEQKELLECLRTKDPRIVDAAIRTHIEYVEEKYIGSHK